MTIYPMMELAVAPSATALLGTTGSQQILRGISSQNSGVLFGQPSDPYQTRYQRFMDGVSGLYNTAVDAVKQVVGWVFNPSQIITICEEDQLDKIPVGMQVPILTDPRLHAMFKNNEIYGWGIDPRIMPSEDVTGRLINNGVAEFHEHSQPKELVWEWKSDDPDYNELEIEHLAHTRQFFNDYIDQQLAKGGQRLDPTGFPDGRIGKLKK